MIPTSFEALAQGVRGAGHRARVGVVAADDAHTLEAVLAAVRESVVHPVLIGDTARITDALKDIAWSEAAPRIVGVPNAAAAAEKAVEMIHAGEIDFVMKGRIETATLMKAIVDRKSGLRTGRVMSHLGILSIPTYHKLLAITDAGLNLAPDLVQKRQILENAVVAMASIGISIPKVAVMAAAEEVNPKLSESVDAAELKRMNQAGDLKDCIVEGPISYDLAVDQEAAAIKDYHSPVAADADIMVVPNLASGNLLVKALIYSAGAKLAGFVTGAKIPIVLTSRSSSASDKHMSLIFAAAASSGGLHV